jgi:hypothetical protein
VASSAGFLLGLPFDPEDGVGMFLSKIRLFPYYTEYNPDDHCLHGWHCKNLKPNKSYVNIQYLVYNLNNIAAEFSVEIKTVGGLLFRETEPVRSKICINDKTL